MEKNEQIKYRAEIRKAGNSYVITVPAYVRRTYDLDEGTMMMVLLEKIIE